MPVLAYGQVVENFEPGSLNNWVQNPEEHWKADTTSVISGSFSLHHVFDNPDAGTDRIGIPVHNLHPQMDLTRWTFTIRHGYDPSSSNNWAVFLMSDSDPAAMSADGTTNGFLLGINVTGYDDTLRLQKVKGKILTTVINCRVNWQTQIGITDPAKIIVERSMEGNWTISVYRLNGNLIGTSSGVDSELFTMSWFGVLYRYSSTRDRLLWFDDLSIEGNFDADNEAPVINKYIISGKNSIDITLSEEPNSSFLIDDNFSLNMEGRKPQSLIRETDLTYRVTFANRFNNKSPNNLIINDICDQSGNCSQNIQISFTPVWAETGDVIISEIMADPLPEVSLPGKEYLELTNLTGYAFNLKNWKLSSESQNIIFPDVIILPYEITILSLSNDTSLFKKYGKVIGLKQFPTLTDAGKLICLTDSSGTFVHGIEYSSDWYGDELKSGGGWSLEMIDTRFPFYDNGNWSASSSGSGGTPGSLNSVFSDNPDTSFHGIQNIFPVDSVSIMVRFSEPVLTFPEGINSIKIQGKEINSLYPADPLFREFVVKLNDPLIKRESYQLEISEDVNDYAGNNIQKRIFTFGLPEEAALGDVLFNELLFNPLPGDADYIEFYNCSPKVIDASRLQLVSVDDRTNDLSQLSSISGEGRCIMPGTYNAITTNKKAISERYFSSAPDFIFETSSLPSLADDEGHLILYNRQLEKIDEIFYNETMHDPLLADYEGVAIEKINPLSSSEDVHNWNSASESCGWGTPGAPNLNMDEEAPVIKVCEVSGKNSIDITLSEEADSSFLIRDNFLLNVEGFKPESVTQKNELTYRVEFFSRFINRSINSLTISNICDKSGNCSQNVRTSFTPVWAETGDVIISEIMADPLPEVSLPGKEYLELTNLTEYPFNLKNWKLTSESQTILFPEAFIQPNEITILCLSKDTSSFKKFGKVIALIQFPSLTDEEKLICLTDSSGTFIHGVEYSSDWYGNELKSGGGWSLEIIDTRFPFYDDGNWRASTSQSGGTPGNVNSVSSDNPDETFYGIQNVFPVDSVSILVRFSEPVLTFSEGLNSIKIQGKEINSLYPADPLRREYVVTLKDQLQTRETYQLDLSEDIKDFAGNSIQKRSFVFGMPEKAALSDVIFNELLFNPLPGDPDYIEFYNSSSKIIDASRLQLVSFDDETGDFSGLYLVSDAKRCFMPGTYYAITTNKKKTSNRYFSSDPEFILETESLPSMADDQGHLILFNRELEKIDEVIYNEAIHDSLLADNEGVAIEKIVPESVSEEMENWHSASESSGWGTPGAPNSIEEEIVVADVEAPVIKAYEISGKNLVYITLNEEPSDSFMIIDNFSLNEEGSKPQSVTRKNELTFRVEFFNSFINRSINVLTISSMCDKSGNCARDVKISFTPIWAETGDVIISEIMADPLPEVSLPGEEYLELTNRTEYPFNLKNWILSSENQNLLFPDDSIQPHEIAILCLSKDSSLFKKYGKVIDLKQFPPLTDGGKLLCLTDSSGTLIHGVEYSSDWYGDELKSDGGWSLEMIDTGFPFYGNGNWRASSSWSGGTPGFGNSVSSDNKDLKFDGIQNVFPLDSVSISVRFSEPVLRLMEESIKLPGKEIISLSPEDPLFREYIVNLKDPLLTRETYKLNISENVKDFAGNRMQNNSFVFGLPEKTVSGDVMFNELLFNPFPGDPDYIELYNCSKKVIDASGIKLVSVNDGIGDTSQIYVVSSERRCIMPSTYYAFTTDKIKIEERYFSADTDRLFENANLPSMSDDKGHLTLFNRELVKLDEVVYYEKMHYSLLSGYEGVALEKMEMNLKSDEPINWHSASESSGWGTPGAPNSILADLPVSTDQVSLSSSKITPDSDGSEDFLEISFTLMGSGNVVSVLVFDEVGNYVRKIASNMLTGTKAILIWDGTTDEGTPVVSGIYIVFITIFDDSGKTEKWKKVCTVIRN